MQGLGLVERLLALRRMAVDSNRISKIELDSSIQIVKVQQSPTGVELSRPRPRRLCGVLARDGANPAWLAVADKACRERARTQLAAMKFAVKLEANQYDDWYAQPLREWKNP